MPSRILRGEALRNSESVSVLSDAAFRLYVLLLTYHEDYGRFDARTSVLRANLFPFRVDRIREADITRWLAECEKAGLIVLYESAARPFGLVLKTAHPRAKKPTAPEPPAGVLCWRSRDGQPVLSATPCENICAQTQTDVNGCLQMRPYSGSGSGSDSSAGSGSGSVEREVLGGGAGGGSARASAADIDRMFPRKAAT